MLPQPAIQLVRSGKTWKRGSLTLGQVLRAEGSCFPGGPNHGATKLGQGGFPWSDVGVSGRIDAVKIFRVQHLLRGDIWQSRLNPDNHLGRTNGMLQCP
jgi:hypothetical protein